MINEILKFNREFVAEKGYEPYLTDKYPDKKIAIVSCMDTRLTKMLPAALGLRNGDVKIIKNAGGVYELGVEEIMIVGHTDCGVQGMDGEEMLHLMRQRGVDDEHISLMKHCGIDLEKWLHGFDNVDEAVKETVDLVRNHPLMPADITVRGYIMDSTTGLLSEVND